MNEKELTDVLYNIKDIIKGDDGANTMVRQIDQLVDWALAQPDFPVPEKELVDFLNEYGNHEFKYVCTGRISGEFCYAEYDYFDEEAIVFKLFWGINDGDEHTVYSEFYWISIEDFKNSKTFEEKYAKVQS